MTVLDHAETSDLRARHATDASIAAHSFRAIGTTVTVVVTDPRCLAAATRDLERMLDRLDRTCSRFRSDSELMRVERWSNGEPMLVSALLLELLATARDVAETTAGIIDPTVGAALVALGYDRDFDQLATREPAFGGPPVLHPAPGWWQIGIDRHAGTVTLPSGMHLDLGSSAKARTADVAALHLADRYGCGVLVNLGGDIAVGGEPPAGGWIVGIAPVCTDAPESVDASVALVDGGIATSGTTARTWRQGGRRRHHIIDPWTGAPASTHWALVSVLAPTCLEANSWSTASVVWAEDAPGILASHGVAARLVAESGEITFVGGWPSQGEVAR